MHIVKENGDGTVTIDRKVYDEMHRRACAERTDWVTLTPDMRAAVNDAVDQNIAVLNTCENTLYTCTIRIANEALRNLINALLDGYPLQIKVKYGWH